MSIIMTGAKASVAADQQALPADEIEPSIRALLDHIAVELAEEYVRLMEAAAEADPGDAR
jgi:hypothetical protein